MLRYKRPAVPVLDISGSGYQIVQVLIDLRQTLTTNGWSFLTGSPDLFSRFWDHHFSDIKEAKKFTSEFTCW